MIGAFCLRRNEWRRLCKTNFVQNLVRTAIVNHAWLKAFNLIKYGFEQILEVFL